MQIVCDPQNIAYYYNMITLALVSDVPYAFLDGKRYPLTEAPQAAGADVRILAEDLEKLFAPAMRYIKTPEGGIFTMNQTEIRIMGGSREFVGPSGWMTMAEKSVVQDGKLYVPAGELMAKGFGKKVLSTKDASAPADPMSWPMENTVVEISNDPLCVRDNGRLRRIHIRLRGKKYGELRECYWMEEARKIVPYNLYVPSTYDSERPSKLLVALHGGRVSEEFIFEKTSNQIQYLCEKYNYILLCPNAVVVDCTYGCLIPNFQFLENTPGAGIEEADADENGEPGNPMHYSPEVISLMKLGEKDVLHTIELVRQTYTIDPERIYMLGNSMGGIGTFHFAASYPGLLKAIAPGGGCPHMDYFKPERLGKIPIRFVYGSEDDWGADLLDQACIKLREAGCSLEVEIIGGGHHGESWVIGLERTFEFFEKM